MEQSSAIELGMRQGKDEMGIRFPCDHPQVSIVSRLRKAGFGLRLKV